jgi:hypothetical protein
MANNIEAKYILAFKPTPRNKDAIYYYKPGKIDTVVVNLRFKGDALMVARLISYLQADVEGKKRFSKGRMELRESCVVEELDPAADPELPAGHCPSPGMAASYPAARLPTWAGPSTPAGKLPGPFLILSLDSFPQSFNMGLKQRKSRY